MGGQIKKLSIVTLGLVVALLAAGLFPMPAWADEAAPTNLQIESAKVFHHLVEDDDFLVVFHYNIHYATGQPSTPANKLFTFRLLDANAIDHLAAIVPYAYYNSGYDQGCAAFYFSKEKAADLGLVWESSYIVRISGNPEYFSSPPVANRTLVISDYCQLETKKENQIALGNYIGEVARDLEVNWTVTLILAGGYGIVLNPTGEIYFSGAVPGLQVMTPQIFLIQTTNPTYEETTWTEEQGQKYVTRFEDTWIGKSLQSLGDMLHVQWNVITGIIVLLEIFGIAIFCQWRYGNIKPASVAGICLILGGTILGWWSPAIMAIITIFVGGLFLGYVWIFRHG
jgi:hypothetical protein